MKQTDPLFAVWIMRYNMAIDAFVQQSAVASAKLFRMRSVVPDEICLKNCKWIYPLEKVVKMITAEYQYNDRIQQKQAIIICTAHFKLKACNGNVVCTTTTRQLWISRITTDIPVYGKRYSTKSTVKAVRIEKNQYDWFNKTKLKSKKTPTGNTYTI